MNISIECVYINCLYEIFLITVLDIIIPFRNIVLQLFKKNILITIDLKSRKYVYKF